MTYHYAAYDTANPAEVAVITRYQAGDDPSAMLRSLKGQSLQSWEWFIVVDSQEPQDEILALCTEEPRIHVVTGGERGWNAGVSATSAPFLCMSELNVELAPTFLEKTIWLVATNPTIAVSNSQSVSGPDRTLWTHGFEQQAHFLEGNFVDPPFVIKRASLELVGDFDPALTATDASWDYWLRLALVGHWGATVQEPLVYYLCGGPGARPLAPDSFHGQLVGHRRQLIGRFPQIALADTQPYEHLQTALPIRNMLAHPPATRRLLILMPWLIVGGAERVNLDLVSYLVARGYEISFATTLTGVEHGWAAEFGRYTSDIFILDRFLRAPDVPRFLVYLLRSRQIDTVMVSNSYLGYQLLPFLRAHCPDITYVDYCHSGDERWNNGGYPRCGAAYQQVLDLNITSSEKVKRWMVGRGADPERIEISYTNVDVERWKPDDAARSRVRAAYGLHDGQLLIIFVGRISAEKRPELLADICRELRQAVGDEFFCAVVGDGPLRDMLAQRIVAHGLSDRMRLLGRLADEDIHAHLAAADALLLPSQVEGISVAVFEAMAMATVPVSADVGGQSELITTDVGFLVPHGPSEVDGYVAALRNLIENQDLRSQMSSAARDRVVQKFPLSAFGPRMEALFEQAEALRRIAPRQAISSGFAQEHTVQALELLRVEGALNYLWAERERWRETSPGTQLASGVPVWWRIRKALAPIYHVAVRSGLTWLVPLRNRLFSLGRRLTQNTHR
jgi:glycosyltransferase involved in cell wall biosynthesis